MRLIMKGKGINKFVVALYYLMGVIDAFITGFIFMQTASFAGGFLGKMIVWGLLSWLIGYIEMKIVERMGNHFFEVDPENEFSGTTILNYLIRIVAFRLILPNIFGIDLFFTWFSVILISCLSNMLLVGGPLGESKNKRYSVKTTRWGNGYSQTKITDEKGNETKIDHWNL